MKRPTETVFKKHINSKYPHADVEIHDYRSAYNHAKTLVKDGYMSDGVKEHDEKAFANAMDYLNKQRNSRAKKSTGRSPTKKRTTRSSNKRAPSDGSYEQGEDDFDVEDDEYSIPKSILGSKNTSRSPSKGVTFSHKNQEKIIPSWRDSDLKPSVTKHSHGRSSKSLDKEVDDIKDEVSELKEEIDEIKEEVTEKFDEKVANIKEEIKDELLDKDNLSMLQLAKEVRHVGKDMGMECAGYKSIFTRISADKIVSRKSGTKEEAGIVYRHELINDIPINRLPSGLTVAEDLRRISGSTDNSLYGNISGGLDSSFIRSSRNSRSSPLSTRHSPFKRRSYA